MRKGHKIMGEERPKSLSFASNRTQGALIGVVLDLSDSMRMSVRNRSGGRLSRIENFSHEFRSVLEDAGLLASNASAVQEVPLRMFINGFGFYSESRLVWSSPIADVFSVLSKLREQTNHYKILQANLEDIWLTEVRNMLEQGKITGDAKAELSTFVENELREQATDAEKKRSVAKFQHWCAFVCQQIDTYGAKSLYTAQKQKAAFILVPMIVIMRWLLRGPMVIMSYLNELFESWLQRKLKMLQKDADKYANRLAERTVSFTYAALSRHNDSISNVLEQAMVEFLDEEAFKIIRLYNMQGSAETIKESFDKGKLDSVYKNVSNQIRTIMSPEANDSWERSIFLLKRASKALKIHPRWNLLKEKTIRCAHQIVWETINPKIGEMARLLSKERFTRAVLSTVIQSVSLCETTLSLSEIVYLMQVDDRIQVTLKELPIFGSSPIGLALTKTFNRLWHEAYLPQNEKLQPAIIIISDGKPTDSGLVDLTLLADKIKQLGIPIICCYVTNRNTARPWLLRQNPGLFWSKEAQQMFSMASSVEEYPQLAGRLKEGRFKIQEHGKLFIQPNHTDYLREFIEAILLPIRKEKQASAQMQIQIKS